MIFCAKLAKCETVCNKRSAMTASHRWGKAYYEACNLSKLCCEKSAAEFWWALFYFCYTDNILRHHRYWRNLYRQLCTRNHHHHGKRHISAVSGRSEPFPNRTILSARAWVWIFASARPFTSRHCQRIWNGLLGYNGSSPRPTSVWFAGWSGAW